MVTERIKEKKLQLDECGLLFKTAAIKLERLSQIELINFSNAHNLTKHEVEILVKKNIMVGKKSIKEYMVAINYIKAINYMYGLIEKPFTNYMQQDIKMIHSLALKNININAGYFRKTSNKIAKLSIKTPDPRRVELLMNEVFLWLNMVQDNLVTVAVEAHLKLVSIHPFNDGNGRCARLFMSLILMRGGYPLIGFLKEDRLKYIKAIAKAQLTNDLTDYHQYMYQNIEKSLDKYLHFFNVS